VASGYLATMLVVRTDGFVDTRRGYDWPGRYPAIASAAAKIGAQSITLDGEAAVGGRRRSRRVRRGPPIPHPSVTLFGAQMASAFENRGGCRRPG
jgi:hypothetical protein